MRFVSVEDETSDSTGLAVDEAISATNAENSTEPSKILEVTNYKEELEKLKAANGEAVEPTDTAADETPTEDTNTESEDDNADGQADTDDSDSTEDSTEEAGFDEDDSTEDSAVSDEDSQDVDLAAESFFELKKLESIAQTTLTKGGITKQHAALLSINLNAVEKRLGFKKPEVLAIENFSTVADRYRNSTIALEGIKETIKEIWEAIKRFFISIYKWFKDALFGQEKKINKTKERIEELKALEKSIKEADRQKVTKAVNALLKLKTNFDTPSAKKLCVKPGTIAFNDVVRESAAYYKFIDKLFREFFSKDLVDKNNAQLDTIESQLQKNVFNTATKRMYITDQDLAGYGFKKANRRDYSTDERPYEVIMSSEMLPGFRKLIVSTVKRERQIEASQENYSFSMGYNNNYGTVQECAALLPTLNESYRAMDDLINRYLDNLKKHNSMFKSAFDKTNRRQEDLLRQLENHMKSVSDKATLAAFKALKNNIVDMNQKAFMTANITLNYFREHVDALVDYMTVFYKQLNKQLSVPMEETTV